jgi:sulfhydrogenase subunit beta (sulfur reductase)
VEKAQGYLKNGLLGEFLEVLRTFGELHAPTVSADGVMMFSPLRDPGDLKLDYRRTQIPPKKYLLPFRDEILRYRDGSYCEGDAAARDTVLFAVHPCDLDGIDYLDRVFLDDRPDPNYRQRRSRLILVGISCRPDDFCFCSGRGAGAPCDLFLSAHDDGFALSAGNERGAAILSAAAPLLAPLGECAEPEPLPSPIPPQDPQLRFSGNPLWEEFARRCVSCGACSVCCPTCYCFDVREYPTLSGGAIRMREWDNCFFVTHGEVSGGNLRPTRLDRIRYRFLHKYCGFSPLQGMTSCVGCGRCKKVCPVDIDLRELLEIPPPPRLP